MKRQAIYTPGDMKARGITHAKDIGNPGEYPFLRGIRETMHTELEHIWTMRQFVGFGSPEATNERNRLLLGNGQTGLSVAFDMPTLLAYDPDNPRAECDIGIGGVSIPTRAAMEKLFSGIDLSNEDISTSMTVNGPASVLLAMYFAVAEGKGASLARLRGTIQADPLKEYIAQNEYILPPRALLKIFVDMVEYCTKVAPRWNPVSISGYHIREAGSTAAQELAFTIANGGTYVEECIARGMPVDSFAPRLSFFWDFDIDFLGEIAKIRAGRRMWARMMKEQFGAKDTSLWMRAHVQTAGITLTKEQPLINIARVAIQALGAVLAGVQSLHTNSYDEQLSLPSEEAVKIALRTQQIIAHETRVREVIDVFGGSYALECMTSDIEEEAYAHIAEINRMGGMVAAVESGWAKQQVGNSARQRQEEIERGEILVVGQNMFHDEKAGDTNFRVERSVQDAQVDFIREVKRTRDNLAVGHALKELTGSVRAGENCMPYIREAVLANATVQEIFDVFREAFGTHKPDVRF